MLFIIREFRSATKIGTEEGTFILFFKIKAWMSGRRFLAYFFGAVDTKNAGSVFEHALHGPKGESQGWLS